mmetsp:Transcript_23080/g.55618  ORF Transcript_23080/g.55618 Transcript_23080/m.55618 type:complete len:279 (-) Transcript_23080:560-1396(-)
MRSSSPWSYAAQYAAEVRARCFFEREVSTRISRVSSVPKPLHASRRVSASSLVMKPMSEPCSASSASSILSSSTGSSPTSSISRSVVPSSPADGSCIAVTHAHAARLKSPETLSRSAWTSGVEYFCSYACATDAICEPSSPASSRTSVRSSVPHDSIACLRREAMKAGVGSSSPCSAVTNFFLGERVRASARDLSYFSSYTLASSMFCATLLLPMISIATCSLKSANMKLLEHSSCSFSACSIAFSSSVSLPSSRPPLSSLKMSACKCLYSSVSSSSK